MTCDVLGATDADGGPGAEAERAGLRPRHRAGGAPGARWRYLPFAVALTMAVVLVAGAPLQLLASRDAGGGGRGTLAVGLAGLTAVVGLRWCAFFVLAMAGHRRSAATRAGDATAPGAAADDDADLPLVSILVPAYNEGETIAPALRSLVATDYPRFEVIVVDDGSTDGTFAAAAPFAGEHGGRCAVRVHRKPNGGKWSALNLAFRRSVGELVLCVDADSRLDPVALRRLVARMRDPAVAAVAGQVRVRNRHNLLTRLQGLEYVIANGLVRLAQGTTGTVLVVPGPIGLFRRAALEEVYIRFGCRPGGGAAAGGAAGPFEGDTFAEDFDLSLSLLALGGRCVYEPGAVSHTKAPDWSFRLISQRYRWCRGTIQVLRKFTRRCAADPTLLRPRLAGWLALTYVLELLVLPLANLAAVALLAASVAAGGSLAPLAAWAAAFMLLNLNAAAFFLLVHGEPLRTLLVLPLYDLYHSVLLNSGLAIAVADEVRGRGMRW